MSKSTLGDSELEAKVQEWLSWSKNEKDNNEIKQLVKDGNVTELRSRLFNRMEFGTAGLRARMGAAYSMMNDLTVIQATQGLCKYMLSNIPESKEMGVCVGYDGRYNSKRFAQLTANIFLQQGVTVYLFSKLCPTPYVAYCTRHYKCAVGVMVTASHNPKEDNGYKVYWSNGAQVTVSMFCLVVLFSGILLFVEAVGMIVEVMVFTLMGIIVNAGSTLRYVSMALLVIVYMHNCYDNVYDNYLTFNGVLTDEVMDRVDDLKKIASLPSSMQENAAFQIISPVDKGISKCIYENLEPWPTSWEAENAESSPLRKDPFDDIHKKYQEDVKKLCYYSDANAKSPVKFTYTAMHGVGYMFSDKSVQQFGFPPVIPVKEQVTPDPEFPTVKYPNPEEGKGALKLSMKTADANDSAVILANDPDADRLALAEKNGEKWTIFTGNEIGALLGWWSWHAFRQNNPDIPASDCYMLASTVSSKILETMAKKEGFNFMETLTGFKWMGNQADKLLKEGKTVLFAFEEAIGYMCGSVVLDKDGVSAAAVCAEMTTFVYNEGGTLALKLEDIYKTYGYHLSSNSYYICHDPPTIDKMFEELRNYNNTGKHPDTCGPYKIKYVRDLTTGVDNSRPDNKPLLPVSKSSHMVTYTFENGCVATLRTSGTEPKIKYYTEHKPDPSKGMAREDAEKELNDIVKNIEKHFYQAEKFNFIPRST